jgi:hypothetical protein
MGGQPNRISDEGVAALARVLESNTTLVTLNLNKNQVTSAGARALGRALAANRSLRVLELRANYAIGDDGVVSLLDAMTTQGSNGTLAVLDFVGCGLGVVGLQRLVRHVESHPGMLNVHLGGWRQRQTDGASGNAADQAARRIQKQLKHNRENLDTEQFDGVHGRPGVGDERIATWLDDIRSIYRAPKRERDDADADVDVQRQPKRDDNDKKDKKNKKTRTRTPVEGMKAKGGSAPDAVTGASTVKPGNSGLKLSVASCLRTRLLNQMRHNRDLAARLTALATYEEAGEEVEVDRNDSSSLVAVERRSESEAFAWAQDLSADRLRAALHQEMGQGKRLEDLLLHRRAVVTGL